jgi:hypothetical protein
MTTVFAWPLRAADLPLATGSTLAGFQFDDRPLVLPVQENFQMALLTASSELGRSCGKMEVYGWRMKQSEQQRVDQIFNNTVDRLRGLGYVVESQTPSSVSHDVTMFTADRPDKHFVFMWSAGEIGLVMALCESSPPMVNRAGTQSYSASMPTVTGSLRPHEVFTSELKTPVQDRATHESVAHFSPLGRWIGSYTCMQGYTGGTLEIDSLKGENFTGVFRFYPTAKNQSVPTGSYSVYGQYDPASRRILINPGKWIVRPHNYYNTVIVGSFDPLDHSFSGYFQGITGCTSFEAKLAGAMSAKPSMKPVQAKKKKSLAKKKKPATIPATALPSATPSLAPALAPASGGIALPSSSAPTTPAASVPPPPSAAAPLAPVPPPPSPAPASSAAPSMPVVPQVAVPAVVAPPTASTSLAPTTTMAMPPPPPGAPMNMAAPTAGPAAH